jgi:RNA polymerase primary sigma factor/RNA polymerase sigma factor
MTDRILNASNYLSRVFEHPDFQNPKKSIEITKDIDFELRPNSMLCYDSPLLSFEQEQHLFRKMNYFKYKAKTLLKNNQKVSTRRLIKIEDLIARSKKVRNQIAESNFRLATQLLRCDISFYQQNSLVDSLLSDAYFDVLKAVDYFNWTLGNKFSTYATWVLKKNFFRDSKDKKKHADKTMRLDDISLNIEESTGSLTEDELQYSSQKKLVQSLLQLLGNGDGSTDNRRQVFVLENYFGLNGYEEQTLEKISLKLGVTKERVRQLKEKGLEWIRFKVKQMKIDQDIGLESFRY